MKRNLHSGGSCGKNCSHLDYNHYDSFCSSYKHLHNHSDDHDTVDFDYGYLAMVRMILLRRIINAGADDENDHHNDGNGDDTGDDDDDDDDGDADITDKDHKC